VRECVCVGVPLCVCWCACGMSWLLYFVALIKLEAFVKVLCVFSLFLYSSLSHSVSLITLCLPPSPSHSLCLSLLLAGSAFCRRPCRKQLVQAIQLQQQITLKHTHMRLLSHCVCECVWVCLNSWRQNYN